MMRLIDADALWDKVLEHTKDGDVIHRIPPDFIDNAPTVDAVPESAFKQIKWERDVAIEQLNSIGKSLGEKMDDIEPVRWVNVPGFEGLYEISTFAQIRNAKGEVIKQQIRREKYTCYKYVSLWKNGRYYKKGVHRLMAETFIPNHNNYPVVNHKDEDGTNNLLSNLEWCSKSYNASYGTAPKKISKAFKGRISEKRIPVQ